MKDSLFRLALLITILTSALLSGCSSKSLPLSLDNQRESSAVQGRWLMDGQAGETMIDAVNRADSSVVIMSRAFVVREDSITERLADRLIERAEDGVTVSVLLPKEFISYFDEMNRQAKEYFEGTPVDLKLQQARGSFGSDRRFYDSGRGYYVSSALLLADGTNLFTGNYILAPDNLTTDNSTTVQFRGPGVYDEVMPSVSPVLNQHNLDIGTMNRPTSGKEPPSGDWSPVRDFTFYLGRKDMHKIFHRVLRKADTTVRLSAWTVGSMRSDPVRTVMEPLLSWDRRVNIDNAQLFYSKCSGKLCAGHTWVDRQYEAYEYQEPEDQYQRFGLIDRNRFYTGSYDLWAASLRGRHYETLVTGYSEPMVSRMDRWLESHRQRAIPVHEERKQISIKRNRSTDRRGDTSLRKRRRSVKTFFHETVLPVVNNNRWDTFVKIVDKKSANSVAWAIYGTIKHNLEQDTGVPENVLSDFEEEYGIESYRESDLENKELLRALLREVVRKDPYFSVIARESVFEYLRAVTGEIQTPRLVEHDDEYRLYQSGRTAMDGDFKWSVWFTQQSGEWKMALKPH